VEVRALVGDTCLGSALGEADQVEEAEDRALRRLLQRLQSPQEPTVVGAGGSAAQSPEERAAASPGPNPASTALARSSGPSLPLAPADSAPATAPEARPRPAAPSPIAEATAQPLASAAPFPAPLPAPLPAPGAAPPPAGTMPPVDRGAAAPEEPPADPQDWSSELARLDLALRRIGWSRDQEAEYLQRAFGHPSRSRLTTYADLMAYLTTLEGLQPGLEPAAVPVPLRRLDLLAQSDALLLQLGWDGERGRQLLEKALGASSRRQLSDAQLLQFNMLLEGALIDTTAGAEAQPGGG